MFLPKTVPLKSLLKYIGSTAYCDSYKVAPMQFIWQMVVMHEVVRNNYDIYYRSGFVLINIHTALYNMYLQKKKEREAAVLKCKNLTKEQKEKWSALMVNSFMSSEESDIDGDEEIVTVHPLPWRSKYVSTMFTRIDDYVQKHKTPQARR